jgi:hypothetical protein
VPLPATSGICAQLAEGVDQGDRTIASRPRGSGERCQQLVVCWTVICLAPSEDATTALSY